MYRIACDMEPFPVVVLLRDSGNHLQEKVLSPYLLSHLRIAVRDQEIRCGGDQACLGANSCNEGSLAAKANGQETKAWGNGGEASPPTFLEHTMALVRDHAETDKDKSFEPHCSCVRDTSYPRRSQLIRHG